MRYKLLIYFTILIAMFVASIIDLITVADFINSLLLLMIWFKLEKSIKDL